MDESIIIIANVINSNFKDSAKNFENVIGEFFLTLNDVAAEIMEKIQSDLSAGEYSNIQSYSGYIEEIMKIESNFVKALISLQQDSQDKIA